MPTGKKGTATKKNRTNTGGGNPAANNQGGNGPGGGIMLKASQLQRINRQLQQWEQGVATLRAMIAPTAQHKTVST